MDIGNIFSKIEGNADKLGSLLGFFGGASGGARDRGVDVMTELEMNIRELMAHPHMPNISHVLYDLTGATGSTSPTFWGGLMALVGGYVLKEVGLDPSVGKLGGALSKAGWGVMLGATAYSIMKHSGLEYSDGGAPPGQPYGGHDGYPKGAGYSPLGRRNGGYFTMPTVAPAGTPNISAVLPASPRP